MRVIALLLRCLSIERFYRRKCFQLRGIKTGPLLGRLRQYGVLQWRRIVRPLVEMTVILPLEWRYGSPRGLRYLSLGQFPGFVAIVVNG